MSSLSAKTRSWLLHIGLASAAAGLGVLVTGSEDGSLTSAELRTAFQMAIVYLVGAVLRSPNDARERDAMTRKTDAQRTDE